jgi:hypothetical protein
MVYPWALVSVRLLFARDRAGVPVGDRVGGGASVPVPVARVASRWRNKSMKSDIINRNMKRTQRPVPCVGHASRLARPVVTGPCVL